MGLLVGGIERAHVRNEPHKMYVHPFTLACADNVFSLLTALSSAACPPVLTPLTLSHSAARFNSCRFWRLALFGSALKRMRAIQKYGHQRSFAEHSLSITHTGQTTI